MYRQHHHFVDPDYVEEFRVAGLLPDGGTSPREIYFTTLADSWLLSKLRHRVVPVAGGGGGDVDDVQGSWIWVAR